MTLRASARAMAVGFAAFAVLCPERSSAEVVDVCKLSQQLAALFDKIGVIPSSHPQLRLYPNKGNRHPSENTAFLKFSKSGRAPVARSAGKAGPVSNADPNGTPVRDCAPPMAPTSRTGNATIAAELPVMRLGRDVHPVLDRMMSMILFVASSRAAATTFP